MYQEIDFRLPKRVSRLVIRHAVDRKLYLYDIINIKKETSTPLEP
jgi:hypothetical protein